jgi:hypothetical protein
MIREAGCSRGSCILPEPHRRLPTSLFLAAALSTSDVSDPRRSPACPLNRKSRLLGGLSIPFSQRRASKTYMQDDLFLVSGSTVLAEVRRIYTVYLRTVAPQWSDCPIY